MKNGRNSELYRKMLYLVQWHKYDRLLAIRTGVTRRRLYIELYDVYDLYKMWHLNSPSWDLQEENLKMYGG